MEWTQNYGYRIVLNRASGVPRVRAGGAKTSGADCHDHYFGPQYEEFKPRTIWSLSNAFTSAFKELDPIPQFKATAKLAGFLEARLSRGF